MKELVELQKALIVGKDQDGANGRYKYRKVDDILRAVREVGQEGIYITLSDELVELAGHVYTKGTATIHNGETSVSASAYAKEGPLPGQSDPQVSGSCSTYARKKALEGLLALDDGNDPDGNPLPQNSVNNRSKGHGKPISAKLAEPSQRKTLEAYLKQFTSRNDVKSIDYLAEIISDPELTFEHADTVIKRAKRKIDEQ